MKREGGRGEGGGVEAGRGTWRERQCGAREGAREGAVGRENGWQGRRRGASPATHWVG